jgi:hypothetical protein
MDVGKVVDGAGGWKSLWAAARLTHLVLGRAGSRIHGWRRTPLAPGGGRGWRRKHAHGGQLDCGAALGTGGGRRWRWKHARTRVEWIGDFSCG